MDKKQFAENVKKLRGAGGLTQEQLAENSGISLRTIQRIEGAEVIPRNDTVIMLANALNVAPSQLADWSLKENKKYLAAVNLSALTFLVLPLLGIILPVIMWFSDKYTVAGLETTAKKVINFQITWLIFFTAFMVPAVLQVLVLNQDPSIMMQSPGMIFFTYIIKTGFIMLPLLVFYNIIITLVNFFRARKGKEEKYFPSIRFFRY